MNLHSSRHCEIRLSLAQLCGVNKAPQQVRGSGQGAPHSIWRKESLPRRAQHRGLAPSRSRHDAAGRVAMMTSIISFTICGTGTCVVKMITSGTCEVADVSASKFILPQLSFLDKLCQRRQSTQRGFAQSSGPRLTSNNC